MLKAPTLFESGSGLMGEVQDARLLVKEAKYFKPAFTCWVTGSLSDVLA